MFSAAQKAAKDLISSLATKSEETLTLPPQCLPEKYSLSQLHDELAVRNESDSYSEHPRVVKATEASKRSSNDELRALLILTSGLGESSRLTREADDEDSMSQLEVWISKIILPDGNIFSDENEREQKANADKKRQQQALFMAQQKATLGLKSLNFLSSLTSDPPATKIDSTILLSALAFTSPSDPWTTPTSVQLANTVLSTHSHQTQSPEFMVNYLLQSIIRPLFSKSRPDTVTESGRKAMPSSAPTKHHDFASERARQPWKYEAPYSVTVFEWAVSNSPGSILKANWHLFIPPLLTLLDSASTTYRVRGLKLLSSFLPRLQPTTLIQSGLDSVFEEAITPTLLFLPSITPLEESLLLLPAAYEALGLLCDIRYQPTSSSSSEPSNTASTTLSLTNPPSAEKERQNLQKTKTDRQKYLDRIFRNGILPGYTHCSDNPAIVEILVYQTGILVDRMGIHSVKHLKDILPILSAVLTDPFGGSRPHGLMTALKTMEIVVLNCWPRMLDEDHRVEVIRALVVCWGCVEEGISQVKVEGRKGEGGGEGLEVERKLEDVKGRIGVVGRLLVCAVEAEVDMRNELGPIMGIEGGEELVWGVFGVAREDNHGDGEAQSGDEPNPMKKMREEPSESIKEAGSV